MKKFVAFSCISMCILFAFMQVSITKNCVVAAASTESINLPIVMYHSVLKSKQGKYTVSPAQLEEDFTAYQKMGYTPVFMREVIAFVDGQGELPQKPMVITFDDGHYNNMHYVLPLAQKFNFKFVISPITSFGVYSEEKGEASNPNYSYLTLPQVAELEKSGLVEIGNHTHNMHKYNPRYGVKQRSTESTEEYATALKSDIGKAQDLFIKAGVTPPVTFAYPFGSYTDTARDTLLKLGFRAMLTCNEGISKVTLSDPSSLYYLKRYNRSGNTTSNAFIKKVFHQIEGEAVPK